MIPTEPIGGIPRPPDLVQATLAGVPGTLLTALAAAVLGGSG